MIETDMLLDRWDAAAAAGVLRSSPSDAQYRLLDGSLHLVLLFNASHAQRKRPVDSQLLASAATSSAAAGSAAAPSTPATSMPTPFNYQNPHTPSPNEVLCALSITCECESEPATPCIRVHAVDSSARPSELPQHAVLVNVSPLMRGHSLVVFDVAQLKPQRLTCAYLANGLRLVQTAREPHFALGFNSAGAWASVNHFHFQTLFMHELSGQQLPVLHQCRRELFRFSCSSSSNGRSAAVAYELPDWPMHCFAVAASDDVTDDAAAFASVVHVAWMLVQLLQTRNVPHNVLLARDMNTMELLAVVFPRQSQCENGTALFGADGGLRCAVAELSGLVVAGSAAVFERFSQDAFERVLADELSLSQTDAAQLVVDWQQQLQSPL